MEWLLSLLRLLGLSRLVAAQVLALEQRKRERAKEQAEIFEVLTDWAKKPGTTRPSLNRVRALDPRIRALGVASGDEDFLLSFAEEAHRCRTYNSDSLAKLNWKQEQQTYLFARLDQILRGTPGDPPQPPRSPRPR